MYSLNLKDGRSLRVSEDHLNQVWVKTFQSNLANPPEWEEKPLTAYELLQVRLHRIEIQKPNKYSKGYTSYRPLVRVENCKPLQFPEKALPVDPYPPSQQTVFARSSRMRRYRVPDTLGVDTGCHCPRHRNIVM